MMKIAAVCYVIPFWIPHLWPLIFLVPACITYTVLRKKSSFLTLFFCSLFIAIGHLLPIGQAFSAMIPEIGFLNLIPGIALVIYYTAIASGILWIIQRFAQILPIPVLLWLFFLITVHWILIPFGMLDGNPFMNPLLVIPPHYLTLLPFFSEKGLLLLFCVTGSWIGYWFYYNNKRPFAVMIMSILPWIIAPLFFQKKEAPAWLSDIAYLPLMLPAGECAQIVEYYLQKSSFGTIILPESSCQEIPLFSPEYNLICGTFQMGDAGRYNTICWLQNKKIRYRHKNHLLPFAEYLPDWIATNWPSCWLFQNVPPTQHALQNSSHVVWNITPSLSVTPALCSELLFDHIDEKSSIPILALCNDWWFPAYFKKLMTMVARFRAIQHQRPVIYVAYYYGLFFDRYGNETALHQLSRE